MRAFLLLAFLAPASAREYNETAAIEYANLAGAAYCDPDFLAAWDCGVKCFSGVTEVKVCQGATTQAYAGRLRERCVIAFEGTNGLASIKVDLDTTLEPFGQGGGMVHSGFAGEWGSLKECIVAQLDHTGCNSNGSGYVGATGHSLGAGVASLAMMDLKQAGFNVVEGYTFGSPAVGNSRFAQVFDNLFDGSFFRVTHGRDPFVDMPPSRTFVHLSPEIYYPQLDFTPGSYVRCDGPDDNKCSAQNFPDWLHWDNQKYAQYHHNYMGVDTTQGACTAGPESCDGDIEDSWCFPFIPCNTDRRGSNVYCHSSTGKCHCDEGYCPVGGKCFPKAQAQSMIIFHPGPSTQMEPLPLIPARPLVPTAGVLGCLLALAAWRSLAVRARQPDLSQTLLEAQT